MCSYAMRNVAAGGGSGSGHSSDSVLLRRIANSQTSYGASVQGLPTILAEENDRAADLDGFGPGWGMGLCCSATW